MIARWFCDNNMKNAEMQISRQRAKYVVTDWFMTAIAFFIFNICRYYIISNLHKTFELWQYMSMGKIVIESFLVPTVLLAVYALSGFYNHPYLKSRMEVFVNSLSVAAVSAALVYLLILLNDIGMRRKDYLVILILIGLFFIFLYFGRYFVTKIQLRKLIREGKGFNVLIIGNSEKSRIMTDYLTADTVKLPYNIVGYIELTDENNIDDGSRVWSLDKVEDVCAREDVNQIVIALEQHNDRRVMEYVDRLIGLNLPIKIAPDTLSYVTSNINLSDILGTPLVDLTSPKLSDFQANLKRTFDVIVSSTMLVVLGPVYLGLMIAVKRSSRGSVIYSQERIGLRQKPFKIYKFRSMYSDAEDRGPQLSSDDDPRITPVGKILRKYRLDELPQFWNVLKGDMSLVGPRPERDFYIRQIIQKAPYYSLIFQVRPGITSWGMVKYGYASNVDEMVARSRFDLIYLNNMSISTDIKIIIYTVRTVINGEGK